MSKPTSVYCYLVESLRGTHTTLRWVTGTTKKKRVEATFEARVQDPQKALQLPERVRPRKFIPVPVWEDALKHPAIAAMLDGAHPEFRAIGPMSVDAAKVDPQMVDVTVLTLSDMAEQRAEAAA